MILVVSAISVLFVVPSNTFNCISLSTYDSPFLKSGIFLQTLTLKIALGRFIIYVESGPGERVGGGGWGSAVVCFFLPVQFLTKTRHFTLKICL